MLVIAQNLDKVDEEDLYATKKHHESSTFLSTTPDSLASQTIYVTATRRNGLVSDVGQYRFLGIHLRFAGYK